MPDLIRLVRFLIEMQPEAAKNFDCLSAASFKVLRNSELHEIMEISNRNLKAVYSFGARKPDSPYYIIQITYKQQSGLSFKQKNRDIPVFSF